MLTPTKLPTSNSLRICIQYLVNSVCLDNVCLSWHALRKSVERWPVTFGDLQDGPSYSDLTAIDSFVRPSFRERLDVLSPLPLPSPSPSRYVVNLTQWKMPPPPKKTPFAFAAPGAPGAAAVSLTILPLPTKRED